MKRTDIVAGFIAGEAIAILANIFFVNFALKLGSIRWLLLVIVPGMTIVGLRIAWELARFWKTLWQLSKFLVTGVLNTAVDLGILNLLIYLTGITSGIWFSAFKGAAFIAAVVNSFIWNKFWTFQKREVSATGKEFSKFFIVSAAGFALNVGIASILVNVIGPPAGISIKLWDNIAAIIAGLAVFAWNFTGYKLIVFKA